LGASENVSINGYKIIKMHPFFHGIDFKSLPMQEPPYQYDNYALLSNSNCSSPAYGSFSSLMGESIEYPTEFSLKPKDELKCDKEELIVNPIQQIKKVSDFGIQEKKSLFFMKKQVDFPKNTMKDEVFIEG
jgi:hypothetical protein